MSSVLHHGWQQALARIEGKAADVVDASDVAGVVVVAGRCMLFKAIVTHITIIEELAGVTILCSDKTGTLTTNKLTIDRDTAKLMPPSVTDCPSYLISSFLFRFLFPLLSVTPGRLALAYLIYLWTDLAFSRDFHTLPSHSTVFYGLPLCSSLSLSLLYIYCTK